MIKKMIGKLLVLSLLVATAVCYALAESPSAEPTDLIALSANAQAYSNAATKVDSGNAGKNATWILDENGLLTISGTGEMWNTVSERDVSWREYRDAIRTVVIEPGVTDISAFAFYGCANLTTVTIPETVTTIERYAFCTSGITSVSLPSGLAVIGERAFAECEGLKTVNIPAGVVSVGTNAFGFCTELTEICADAENTVVCDVDGILFSKDKRQLVQYPAGRTDEEYAVPVGVTTIKTFSFSECAALRSVTIPNGVTSIGTGAFFGCSNLTSVIIPEGVTTIRERTFYTCSSLSSVSLPSSITDIDAFAFYQCGLLSSINIPAGVDSIGAYAFSDCGRLTGITLPDSVTSIGMEAFYRCGALETINLPAGVTEIKTRVFYGCGRLTDIKIPDGVTTIESDAFYGCSSLTEVVIPGGVDRIGRNAFFNCSGLTSVTLKQGISAIENQAFRGCSSLTSINIPASVTEIGSYAFAYCSNLREATISGGIIKLEMAVFYYCSSLTDVVLPEGVLAIWEQAFYGCSSLTGIKLPDSIIRIEEYAFADCTALAEIAMPSSIIEVGAAAFMNCKKLADVYYGGTVEQKALISMEHNQCLNDAVWHCAEGLPLISLAGENGTMSIRATNVGAGSRVEVKVTPAKYHCFSHLLVNGTRVDSTVFTVPKADAVTVQPVFEKEVYTYTVIHYLQDAFGGSYSKGYNKQLTAEAGTTVTAIEGTYYGFVEDTERGTHSGVLKKNNSLTLLRYYTRVVTTLTYDTDGGPEVPAVTKRYGDTLYLPKVSRCGYAFLGWFLDAEHTVPAEMTTMPIENMTLYAKWEASNDADRGIEYSINGITLRKSGTMQTLSSIPQEDFVAEVSITNHSSRYTDTLVLAVYDKEGRMLDLICYNISLDEGKTSAMKIMIQNPQGKVGEVKAFMITTWAGMKPLAVAS